MSWETYIQTHFLGENLTDSPDLIKSGELVKAYNCVSTKDGAIQTRLGKTKINTNSLGSSPVLAIFRWAKDSGTQYLTVQHGTSLYNTTWDGASTISSFTEVKTGLTASAVLKGVVWKDNLILTNGSDNVFRFDGTTCSDLTGSPPKSKYIKVYANQLFLVDVANPNHIRWSGISDYNSWDALDVIAVNPGSGDIITGLAAQPTGLIIFKQNSAWGLFGNNRFDFSLQSITTSVGCIAPNAIIDDGFVVGSDSFFRFNTTGLSPIGQTHRNLLATYGTTAKSNIKAAILPKDEQIVVSLDATRQISIDTTTGNMYQWGGLNVGCLAVNDTKVDDGNLLIGDATAGFIYKLSNTKNDDGTAIKTIIRSPNFLFDTVRDKVFRRIEVDIQVLSVHDILNYASFNTYVDRLYNNTVDIVASDDFIANTLVWGSGNWGEAAWDSAIVNLKTYLHNTRGARVGIEIQSNNRIRLDLLSILYRKVGIK